MIFIPNNSTKSRAEYIAESERLEIPVTEGDLVLSTYTTTGYVANERAVARVYMVGAPGRSAPYITRTSSPSPPTRTGSSQRMAESSLGPGESSKPTRPLLAGHTHADWWCIRTRSGAINYQINIRVSERNWSGSILGTAWADYSPFFPTSLLPCSRLHP